MLTAPVRRAADSLIVSYHQHNNPLLRVFVWTIQEDAARRDFTINGLFYNPQTRQIEDFVDGYVFANSELERILFKT